MFWGVLWVSDEHAGYGQSEKPKGSDSHVEYSKREMGNDQVRLM
jgi:haloacetate dehalogenase